MPRAAVRARADHRCALGCPLQPSQPWTAELLCNSSGQNVLACGAGGTEEDTKDRAKQKACLERYRRACWEILAVLHKEAPQVPMLTARSYVKPWVGPVD